MLSTFSFNNMFQEYDRNDPNGYLKNLTPNSFKPQQYAYEALPML